uniref:DUF4236 domain-containing protein n=1 Tax=Alistipes sp. D31t1_170403_E11 TaxID=2787128 RepID=UPI00189ABC15|nr:DUF4236 domain-containing protein [Alistipes sp. D31t1_170403_E11]
MGLFNFRKRVKIAPGIKLNLSKSGISTSVGVKGASVTVGPKGTYVNNSIPGTGIYKRTKISGSGSATDPDKIQPMPEPVAVTDDGMADARLLLDKIRADLEALDLQDKNVVIIVNTFSVYLLGIVKNLLKTMGVKSNLIIKKTTNVVLIGDKKDLPKGYQSTIDRYNEKGGNIVIHHIAV